MTTESVPDVRPAIPVPVGRRAELRVKIKSLAAEIRIIRQEEVRALRARRRTPEQTGGFHRVWHTRTFETLREHRMSLRIEARHAQLAYAFLLGRPYWRCEKPRRSNPEALRIAVIAQRFGSEIDHKLAVAETARLVEEWLVRTRSPADS